MSRLVRPLAIVLVAAATAAGSVAWAGTGGSTATHRAHMRRGAAVHRAQMRCDAMRHRFHMRAHAAQQKSLSPRQQRVEQRRFARAQRRAEHRCARLHQRAAGHPRSSPRTRTTAAGSTEAATAQHRRTRARTAAG